MQQPPALIHYQLLARKIQHFTVSKALACYLLAANCCSRTIS